MNYFVNSTLLMKVQVNDFYIFLRELKFVYIFNNGLSILFVRMPYF